MHGRIFSPDAKEIRINDSVITLNQQGEFEYKADLKKPKFFKLRYQHLSISLFIQAGEDLHLSFDASRFPQSVSFKGISADENYLLLKQDLISPAVNDYISNNWFGLNSSPESLFFSKIDSLRHLFLDPLDSLQKKNGRISPTFVFQTRGAVEFSFDKLLLIYPQQYAKFTGEVYQDRGIITNYLNKVDLDQKENIEIEEYASFGKMWIDAKVKEKATASRIAKVNWWLNGANEVILKTFKNKDVIDVWRFQYLKSHIENNGISDLENNIAEYNKTAASKEFKEKINTLYQSEKINREKAITKTYKSIDGLNLKAFVFKPKDLKKEERRLALVYFHGGSWSEGKPDWYFGNSQEGYVTICVEYRTFGRNGVMPFEEVSDTKSFFRWLRQNAEELNVDTSRIVAEGNSAGGHLILCAAMLDGFDEPYENTTVSSKPNALIINAGVYDLSNWMWFDEYVKDKEKTISISPLHNIKAGLPPILLFHGINDGNVPFSTAEAFVEKMKTVENNVEFIPIKDAQHELWFNQDYQKISGDIKSGFLEKLGFN